MYLGSYYNIFLIYRMFKEKFSKEYTNLYYYLHLVFGAILAIPLIPLEYRLILLLTIILYQFGQLSKNIRYFMFENRIEKGNSMEHTLNKLKDYFMGFIVILIIDLLYKNFD